MAAASAAPVTAALTMSLWMYERVCDRVCVQTGRNTSVPSGLRDKVSSFLLSPYPETSAALPRFGGVARSATQA